jgi:hypothetical protein
MPTTQQTVTPKEALLARVNRLSPAEMTQVSNFIDSLDGDEPNEETAAALRESADMRNLIGPFHNVEDLMASLLDEDDA